MTLNNLITLEELTFLTIQNIENKLFKNKIDCLGLEVAFAKNKRRADILLVLKNNHTIGFELKSDYDNLSRLQMQIQDYEKTFDYTYLVLTKKYIGRAIDLLSDNTGIILYENDTMNIIKKAKKSKQITADSLMALINNKPLHVKEFTDLKKQVVYKLKKNLNPYYKHFKDNYLPPYNIEHIKPLSPNNIKTYLGW